MATIKALKKEVWHHRQTACRCFDIQQMDRTGPSSQRGRTCGDRPFRQMRIERARTDESVSYPRPLINVTIWRALLKQLRIIRERRSSVSGAVQASWRSDCHRFLGQARSVLLEGWSHSLTVHFSHGERNCRTLEHEEPTDPAPRFAGHP
jgi:hypothetical protein